MEHSVKGYVSLAVLYTLPVWIAPNHKGRGYAMNASGEYAVHNMTQTRAGGKGATCLCIPTAVETQDFPPKKKPVLLFS